MQVKLAHQQYQSYPSAFHTCHAEEDASEGDSGDVSQHDEACAICYKEDDADMLLCDGCPKVFHLSCLGLNSIPEGQWYCAVCNDGLG